MRRPNYNESETKPSTISVDNNLQLQIALWPLVTISWSQTSREYSLERNSARMKR